MSDIINILPDSVANQIAAGEVVDRPASAVKELLENALDAGASKIQLIVKDAGRTLIQVIDNGCGMSDSDARICFERHATSKIHKADDLFAIHTMGFRGEALASIAAIAQVELKSRLHDNELGTLVLIEGSQVKEQSPCACPCGTSIAPVMERWVAQYGPAGVSVTVQPIRNTFFGETVTVTGLITGGDLISQLKDADEDEILLCGNTLREQGDKFLDDVTLEQVRAALKPRLTVVPNTGADLFRALIGKK